MKKLTSVLTALVVAASMSTANAQVTIDAFKDSAFFAAGFVDGVPSFTFNNFGAYIFVPVAHANNDRVNRAVFQFDIAGNVPSGATITNATFEFEVTQQGGPGGQTGIDFSLHRVTTAWDEGTGDFQQGEPTGDGVTWDFATAMTMWTTPGGDFDATTSGTVFVDGPTSLDPVGDPATPITYSISSAKLIQDVQDIIDGTATDNGFLLKGATESPVTDLGSAGRVTTREGGNAAKLVLEFSTGVLLGDVNMDGVVDLLDVQPFVDLIANMQFQAEADVNEDGSVDLLDVQPFVDILTGG